jgi:excisionase family DNA binding protein
MQLLSKKEVAARIGVHPEHVMRMVRAHRFPAPVRLGGDGPSFRVRWPESEIDQWINERMAARP